MLQNYILLSVFSVLIFMLSAFAIQDVHATSGTVSGESSCIAIGGLWNGVDTCTFSGNLTVGPFETLSISEGITLILSNSAGTGITLSSTTSTLNNSGELIIQSVSNTGNGAIYNFGTINNSGMIKVQHTVGTGINNYGLIDNKSGGKIILDFEGRFGIGNGSFSDTDNRVALTNSGTITILTSRIGGIYTDGKIGVTNNPQGIIDIQSPSNGWWALYFGGESTFNNAGTITVSNSSVGGIRINEKAIFYNTGTINVLSGSSAISVLAQVNNSGTINVENIEPFGYVSVYVELGGVFHNTNSGIVNIKNSGTGQGFFITGATLNNTGIINVENTGPQINNSYGININNGKLNNSGTINIANSANIGINYYYGFFDNYPQGRINVNNTEGIGIQLDSSYSSFTFNNSGEIIVSNSAGTGIENNGSGPIITNPGKITVKNTGGTGIINTSNIDNPGTIVNCGTLSGTIPTSGNPIEPCPPGIITIIKDTVPNNAQNFGFVTTGGLTPVNFSLDDDSDPILSNIRTYNDIPPGTYTITEGFVSGFALTGLSCVDPDKGTTVNLTTRAATIDLDAGENITCTYTNSQTGTITIIEDTIPDDSLNFAFTTTGLIPINFSLDDDADAVLPNTRVYSNVVPGNYIVTENIATGFTLSNLTCVDPDNGTTINLATRAATIDLDSGENITCTYTNTQPTSLPKITINNISKPEPNSGTPNFDFIVTRSDNLTPISVQYKTTDVTATSSDYVAISPPRILDFAAGGPLTSTITVTVNSDNVAEPDEIFYLELSNCIGCEITTLQGIGTIQNDDIAGIDVRTLDRTGNVGTYTSIAIGNDGFPVMSYRDETNNDLKFVHCTNVICSTQNAPRILDSTGNVGTHTSIAIGNDGFPVISYRDDANNYLKFVHCTNVICSTQDSPRILDSTGNVGTFTSIAIGTDGFPVISYRDATTNDLKSVHCTNINCSTQDISRVLDSTGNVGTYTSIAIGADGFPVISYRDDTNNDLKFVHCTNVICSTQDSPLILDSAGNVGTFTSIAIGTDGFPVISYRDATNNYLKFVHCTNINCSTQEISRVLDSTGNVGTHTSIAIGADGFPVVSYRDNTNNDLKFVHCTNINCSTQDTPHSLDSIRNMGIYTSIAIGADGFPVMSYRDATNDDLKITHCNNSQCN